MAKKVTKVFKVSLRKNTVKGGAWLSEIAIADESGVTDTLDITAWSNASAAKRHVKERVQTLTPRKSVKLTGGNFDEKEKPTLFTGEISYKVDN